MKNFYKHALLVIICLFATVRISLAQDFLPVLNDNYMGINQVTLQPAAIVDSRFKVDVNLLGFNNDMFNDFVHVKFSEVFKSTNGSFLENINYVDNPNGKDKNAYIGETYLGPGFLINIDDKNAIGFTTRIRHMLNVDDISEPLARSYVQQWDDSQYWNKWYYDKVFRVVDHIFQDYGLSYAREVLNSKEHYLKTGITVKLLQGLGASSLQPEEFYFYAWEKNGNPDDKADFISMNSDITRSGLSDNWNWGSNLNDKFHKGFTYQFVAKPSIGLDLGVVYEFRPKYLNYKYNMDGQKDLIRKDQNQYLLKVGVSILDIGRLKYNKEYNSQDFSANFTQDYKNRYNTQNNSVPANTNWRTIEGADFGFPPFVNFADTIYQRMLDNRGTEAVPGNEDKFTVKLPTALSLQVDVNIIKGLFVNLTTFTSLHQGFDKTGNSHYMSQYSITPRYEHRWFGVEVPVYYNQFQKINVGLGLRAAFLYIGVNNLFTVAFSDTYGINFYFGVKIPIWQDKPPKDMDGDGVSDDKDACPNARGTWELMGCPDSDGDGVTDAMDECPNVAGLKELNGCPDSDGDGVLDKDDHCPLTPGDPANFGCPVIKVEEAAVLKTAFENLEFETGKAVIRSSSFASLDELAALLISKPLWKLRISGHTDNVGNDQSNMTLSKNRAQAVEKFLKGKGVAGSQILTEWFGETRPIADNNTAEGRQQNRRVEMQVVFD